MIDESKLRGFRELQEINSEEPKVKEIISIVREFDRRHAEFDSIVEKEMLLSMHILNILRS